MKLYYKGVYSAPKWAKAKRYLEESCFFYDLELEELNIEKGWIRESGFFKVSGLEKDIKAFIKDFNKTTEEFNN